MPAMNCFQGVSSGQHAKTMPVMKHLVFQSMSLVAAIMPVINGLVFQSVHEWFVFQSVHEWSRVSEGAWMVICLKVCLTGLVFQSVHGWSCVSEGA